MRKINKTLFFALATILIFTQTANAFSTRHHVINMGKNAVKLISSPFYGLFIKGPKNVKEVYQYETGKEKTPQEKPLLKKKLFAYWSSPAAEIKGLIDGLVGSTEAGGQFLKEFLSIFFSD